MTTRTLTLTEFLLARIAEDEAAARESYEAVPPAFGAYGRLMLDAIDYLIADPDRVLAECEAKRLIVERFQTLLAEHFSKTAEQRHSEAMNHPHLQHWQHHRQTEMHMLVWVLECHAAVYADHPDYRREWRP